MAIFRRDVLALLRFWLTSCWFAREVRVDFAGIEYSEKRMGDKCFYRKGERWASPERSVFYFCTRVSGFCFRSDIQLT